MIDPKVTVITSEEMYRFYDELNDLLNWILLNNALGRGNGATGTFAVYIVAACMEHPEWAQYWWNIIKEACGEDVMNVPGYLPERLPIAPQEVDDGGA